MANKRAKQKKPKQNKEKSNMSGNKGGRSQFDDFGSPQPVKNRKK